MAELNINGRMSVKKLKQQFKEAFGASLRVYNGKELADDDARLASIRTGDAKGGELSVRGNMKVGGFEKKMLEIYGISVQVADAADTQLVPDDVTIASVVRFQSGDTPVAEPAPVPEPAVPAAAPAPAIDIDRLIGAALMDGVVTDKERAILIKKAVAQGIDPDEFEMILDAKILEKGASTPPVAPAVHAAALAAAAAAKKAEEEAAAQKAAAEAEAKAQAEAEAKAQADANNNVVTCDLADDGKFVCKCKSGQTLYFKKNPANDSEVWVTSQYEGMWGNEPTGDVAIPQKVEWDGQTYIVTGIDNATFFDCSGLVKVDIPDTVRTIGELAFNKCIRLNSVSADQVTSIGTSAFQDCTALTSACFPQVKTMGEYAFKDCKAIEVFIIPNGVTEIMRGVFAGAGLKKVVIPSTVVSIGREAFYSSKLEKVVIPSSVLKIGYCAFWKTNLKSVIIPNKKTEFAGPYSGDWNRNDSRSFECNVTI